MEFKGITLKADDQVLGVDFSNENDNTIIVLNMTVSDFNEMKRLVEVGEAAEWAEWEVRSNVGC